MAASMTVTDYKSSDLSGISLSGISIDQLSDIISQMKDLIDQNEQLARQIMVENPVLTRALYKAQAMLGMFQHPLSKPMQTSGLPHLPFQLPQPSVPAFPHQPHSHMGGIAHSGAPQRHHLQPASVIMPPPSMRPSFRQAPLSSQSPYQIGNSSVVGEFGTQMGGGTLPLAVSDQMGSSPIISEVEKAFIRQILNLTLEQLDLLPPEQKSQLMLLKEILLSHQ